MQLTQREGELIQEKAEVKKLAIKFSEAGTVEVPDFGSSGKAFQNY